MRLGISMWSYFAAWKQGRMDIPGFIRECKALEVDGVELLDFFWQDRESEMPRVHEALEQAGLPVGVYSVSNNFVQIDPAEHARQIDVVRAGVDTARLFGTRVVRVFAGNTAPGVAYEQAVASIVDGLRASAEYAAERGVVLALENHGLLAGRSDQIQLLLDAVNHPALKANPDTGNFLLVHEASHDAVAALASRAAMVHFKDFQVVPDDYKGAAYVAVDGLKFAGTAVGEGHVDLPDCLRALRHSGFDGWLNIEYEAEEDPLVGVRRSVQYTKSLLAS